MPTSLKARKVILKNLPEDLISNEIYELGSGWGTLVFPLAQHYPKCTILGYEAAIVPYLFSKIRLYFSKNRNIFFLRKNFINIDLKNASLIVIYLFPSGMAQLNPKLKKELQPGSYIISNTFALQGWKPLKTLMVNDLYQTKVYIYKIDNNFSFD